MKKLFCLSLAVILLLFPGCSRQNDNTVCFSYLNSELSFGAEESIIVSEEREISTHANDLPFLLSLYLAGPLEDNCLSPFPAGTHLLDLKQDGDQLHLYLSEEFAQLETIKLSIAGACLASTCFSLTEAAWVHIYCDVTQHKPVLTLTRDSLTLFETSTPYSETIPTT